MSRKIQVLLLVVALTAALIGCSDTNLNFLASPRPSGATDASLRTTGPLGTPPAPPKVGETLYGRLSTVPVLVYVKSADMAGVRQFRSEIEALGLKVSPEGDVVVWPASPASGWSVVVGKQTVVTDAEGNFSFTPQSATEIGTFYHPSGFGGGVNFYVGLLGRAANAPKHFAIPMAFRGPCGMDNGKRDEEFCGLPVDEPAAANNRIADGISARFVPPEWVPPVPPETRSYGVQLRELGTYPPPQEAILANANRCPDIDGTLQGKTKIKTLLYFGSTCHKNVLEGNCPNENPISDAEYRAFAATHFQGGTVPELKPELIGGALVGFLDNIVITNKDFDFLTPPADTGVDTSCSLIHHGRLCAMFQSGDLAVQVGTKIARASTVEVDVKPGQAGTFVVHNNGVFGVTDIRKSGAPLTLTSPFLVRLGDALRLKHYPLKQEESPVGGIETESKDDTPYEPDRVVNFKVPDGAVEGDVTTVNFTVDNSSVVILFKVKSGASALTAVPSSYTPGGSTIKITAPPDANFKISGSNARIHWKVRGDTNLILSDGTQSGFEFDSVANNVTLTTTPSTLADTLTVSAEAVSLANGQRTVYASASIDIPRKVINSALVNGDFSDALNGWSVYGDQTGFSFGSESNHPGFVHKPAFTLAPLHVGVGVNDALGVNDGTNAVPDRGQDPSAFVYSPGRHNGFFQRVILNRGHYRLSFETLGYYTDVTAGVYAYDDNNLGNDTLTPPHTLSFDGSRFTDAGATWASRSFTFDVPVDGDEVTISVDVENGVNTQIQFDHLVHGAGAYFDNFVLEGP